MSPNLQEVSPKAFGSVKYFRLGIVNIVSKASSELVSSVGGNTSNPRGVGGMYKLLVLKKIYKQLNVSLYTDLQRRKKCCFIRLSLKLGIALYAIWK